MRGDRRATERIRMQGGADPGGNVSLVNVFAWWCVACREEHPVLLQLSRQHVVPIHGLNCKVQPADRSRRFSSNSVLLISPLA